MIARLVAAVAADDRLGVAPNVAKDMHIGYLRTRAIGDAFVRVLNDVGHDVVRENHIGDWGRPFNVELDAGGDFQHRSRRASCCCSSAIQDLACVVIVWSGSRRRGCCTSSMRPRRRISRWSSGWRRWPGWVPPARAEHVAFGNVLGPNRKMLKSRSGESMRFIDVIDEAIERGRAAVAEKNPEVPPEQRDVSASRSASAHYAHARVCSIFRRAEAERVDVRDTTPVLGEAQERTLAMRLPGFGTAVAETVERSSPHRLCTYLYELASDFTAFYERCPVLKAPDASTRASRLALSDVTARVLARGLHLLAISAPEQM